MLVTSCCGWAQCWPRWVSRGGHTSQGLCSPQAAAALGGPTSSMNRASAWWEFSWRPASGKPIQPQAPLCMSAVLSVHSACLPGGIFGALTNSPALPPTLKRQNTKRVRCSGHHSALHTAFPKEAGHCPSRASGTSRRYRGGAQGPVAVSPPFLAPPHCVLRVSSAPRPGNDCQLILHYFSDADQLLNCCKWGQSALLSFHYFKSLLINFLLSCFPFGLELATALATSCCTQFSSTGAVWSFLGLVINWQTHLILFDLKQYNFLPVFLCIAHTVLLGNRGQAAALNWPQYNTGENELATSP